MQHAGSSVENKTFSLAQATQHLPAAAGEISLSVQDRLLCVLHPKCAVFSNRDLPSGYDGHQRAKAISCIVLGSLETL